MAEDIGGICREYVDENAAGIDTVSEDEAVASLAAGARQRLRDMGWGQAEISAYNIQIESNVREQLRKHRER